MTFEIGQVFEKTYPPEVSLWCVNHEAEVVELETENGLRLFQIQSVPQAFLTEEEEIESEIRECEQWLSSHDYIGTKIATGRATKEEYASEIAEMNRRAERLHHLLQKNTPSEVSINV